MSTHYHALRLPAARKAHKGQPHNPQLKEQRGVRAPAPLQELIAAGLPR